MRRITRFVLTLAALAAAPGLSMAQGFGEVGTRASGMGGAFVGVADDATAVYWNPAGLAFGSYVTFIGDRVTERPGRSGDRHSSLFIGLGLPPLGLSYYRLHAFGVTRQFEPTAAQPGGRNEAGTGDLRLERLATGNAGVTLVQSIVPGVAAGSTLRYVHAAGSSKIDADVGVMATRGRVKAGVAVRNLAAPAFETAAGAEVKLQRQARAGVAVAVAPSWIVAADVDLVRTAGPSGAEGRETAIGTEGHITKRVTVRAGVRRQSDEASGLRAHSGSVGASFAVTSAFMVDTQITGGGDRGLRGWGLSGRFVLY